MTQPLVSILMNCYNGEQYLRQAIESVIAQTYRNWEIVFWDNQSTDGSAAIARGYRDPRIRYFPAPTHTTLYAARNLAIAESSGEYIAFLDVDDWWAPGKLEAQMPLFGDSRVGMVASNYWIENELKGTRHLADAHPRPTGRVLNELLQSYYVGVLTLVVRRAALQALDYMCDPRYTIIGDFDLVIRLASQWNLGYVQEPLAHYRVHATNLQRVRRDRHIEEMELWLGDVGNRPPVRDAPGLAGFQAEVTYAKAMNELLDGRRWTALGFARRLPMGRFKARILAASLLPTSTIRRLKNS